MKASVASPPSPAEMTFPTQALALLLVSGAAGAAPEYSPAFFWSPRASASPIDHLEHYGPISGPQVEHIATSLGNLRPEVYLVFVAEGLATQGVREHAGHLPSLERAAEKWLALAPVKKTTVKEPPQKSIWAHAAAAAGEAGRWAPPACHPASSAPKSRPSDAQQVPERDPESLKTGPGKPKDEFIPQSLQKALFDRLTGF